MSEENILLKHFKCDPYTHLNRSMQPFIEKVDKNVQNIYKSFQDFKNNFKNDITEVENNEKRLLQGSNTYKDNIDDEIFKGDILNHGLKVKKESIIKDIDEKKSSVKATEKDLKDFLQEVVIMEQEKERRKIQLINERDTMLKVITYYKLLDVYIEYESPDTFKFIFSKNNSQWITLKSYEFEIWEIFDATLEENDKFRLADVLKKTGNPVTIIAMARDLCLKKKLKN